MKILKFFVAVVLLPFAFALTLTLGQLTAEFSAAANFWSRPVFYFGLGCAMWIVIFLLLPPPVKTYVLGHELTHALWALLMGGRVRGLRVGKKSGHVRTTVSNFWVTLAPYFFPIYTAAVGLLFWLAGLIWDTTGWSWVLFYTLGFTWSYHLTFTGLALSQRQADVQEHGWLFSIVVIYCANLLVALVILMFLKPDADVWSASKLLARDVFGVYSFLFNLLSQTIGQLTKP